MRSSNSIQIFPKRIDNPLLLMFSAFALLGLLTIYSSAYSEEFPSLFSMQKEYGKQAIIKHGPFKGGFLSIKRIGKCHPWGSHGYDPIPNKMEKK